MRKCFFDNLPKKEGIGKNKGKMTIDWKNSINSKVEFIYDDIQGYVTIVDYCNKTGKLKIIYNKDEYSIFAKNLIECRFGKILNKITSDHKFSIGDNIKSFTIIDCFYVEKFYDSGYKKIKFYKYRCNKCRYIGEISENHLLDKKRGCPCCNNKISVLGINTIWDTDRWMCDLGVSEKDAKTHTHGSNDKITVICPHCGKEKDMRIADIYNHKSIGCSDCGDGVSYPEKFIISLLNQLQINYVKEYMPNWSNNKRYDFYLPKYNCIIECHGMQHYGLGFESCGGKTLEEEQENDKFKKTLAMNNKIDNYIILDCRKSELDWIKNSILDSKLNNLFNLNNIDWIECERFAINSNILKEICNYWNQKEDWETTTDLAKIFNINRHNILKKIKKGSKIGLCNYKDFKVL